MKKKREETRRRNTFEFPITVDGETNRARHGARRLNSSGICIATAVSLIAIVDNTAALIKMRDDVG